MANEAMKQAQIWFASNDKVSTYNHWRWAELSVSSRENMLSARNVRISGHRAIFGPHQSEMDLRDISRVIVVGEECRMEFISGGFVCYRSI